MARDFAKHGGNGGRGSTRKRPARRERASSGGSSGGAGGGGWRLYFAGVVTGVFASFLAYLATLPGPGPGPAVAETQESATPAAPAQPKPRFDFYNTLPAQRLEADLPEPEKEPSADLPAPGAAAAEEQFLLQAGSFRQREDAERRRAELLLLGLEPSVEEASGDNGNWHRVYLGPFRTHAEMSRVRGLTANQDIDTLLVKRGAN